MTTASPSITNVPAAQPRRPSPTPAAIVDKIQLLVKAVEISLINLYGRWQDEKQYEDFKDYADVMKSLVQAPFIFVGATKRPFGFIFRAEDPSVAFVGEYTITINSRVLAWKRIK